MLTACNTRMKQKNWLERKTEKAKMEKYELNLESTADESLKLLYFITKVEKL